MTAYMTSTKRLTSTKTIETNRMPPWRTGKSRTRIAFTSQVPIPGQAKTVSVSTAPERSRPVCRPMIVAIGSNAFRSTWRESMRRGDTPFARAVRT